MELYSICDINLIWNNQRSGVYLINESKILNKIALSLAYDLCFKRYCSKTLECVVNKSNINEADFVTNASKVIRCLKDIVFYYAGCRNLLPQFYKSQRQTLSRFLFQVFHSGKECTQRVKETYNLKSVNKQV